MQIKRSLTKVFGILVIPAICGAAIAYFGYYTIWGTRGVLALTAVQARLAVQQGELVSLQQDRAHLEHRIDLLREGSEDSDMIEEIARSQLLGTTPGQIAVPRDKN